MPHRSPTFGYSQNRTIVRALSVGLPHASGAASRIFPAMTAQLAARLWFGLPSPAHSQSLLPDGGDAFTATFEGHLVRGTCWGAGPVVYLVHGWAGDGGQLAPLVPPLLTAGFRVVTFDAPSHGQSEPGPSGPGRSHGVEFGKALDAVAAVHGPAHAVVAHSMGAIATLLTLRFGWLSTEILVFLAPMCDVRGHLDQFTASLRLGRQARRRIDAIIETRAGLPVDEFDLRRLRRYADAAPLLVVHDRSDQRAPLAASAALVAQWPGATLITTQGFGHRRLLAAPAVHHDVVRFIVDPPPRHHTPERFDPAGPPRVRDLA